MNDISEMLPKVLAVYLPQFHRTKDNDYWWGKGFTDWESVKKNHSYFPGHEAPYTPVRDNYYDLSDIRVMQQQSELAQQYGVDGFCFYHYYFKNGKKELELPAENLLRHPEISMPFCFIWANESWVRSWSKFSGNVWGEQFEKCGRESKTGLLVEQDYGHEAEWKKHFRYLLPFFHDQRYLKIDKKPIFIFYRPLMIPCLREMTDVWRLLARQAGFPGIYLIGVNVDASLLGLDAALIYQPRTAIVDLNCQGKASLKNHVRCFSYADVWKRCLDVEPYAMTKTYFMGLSGYDDTARRGQQGECVIERSSMIFRKSLSSLICKSKAAQNEFVFLNAWNEWGEGMYLEPDQRNGFAYLQAIKEAKEDAARQLSDTRIESLRELFSRDDGRRKELQKLQQDIGRYAFFVQILTKWLECEREQKLNLHEWMRDVQIGTVAIYGLGVLGRQLYQQLEKEGVHPSFGIDQYVGAYGEDFQIFRPEDHYPDVDAIIVTVYAASEVCAFLKEKVPAQIITIQDMIDKFWRA